MTDMIAGGKRRVPLLRRFVGLAEAMATPHGVDRYTELIAPTVTVNDLRAQVTDVRREGDHSVTLSLRPTRQWRGFRAGQFVRVGVVVDGVRHTRCFSPCGSEHGADGRLELTVKAHPSGLVSQELLERARPGLMVDLAQAAGEFHLPMPRPRDIVLISAGSGITPVLAMLRTLVDERHDGRVAFLHYVRRPEALVHAQELRRLAAARGVTVIVGCTAADGAGDVDGHFSAGHLAQAAPWVRGAQTYLCGPARMMAAVREVYDGMGLGARLHTEAFDAAPAAVPSDDEVHGTVTFSASGIDAANTGDVLLEQAEAAGLSPEHGCRMGICFSCTAVRRSGCTRNALTGEADAEPDQQIQLCINRPVGDVDIAV
ncbi:ferredoxin reductase [Tomitella gaofuii]|uniref:ferredoxin reductase n=1 Tax=Tomitella gaofuii TaxID=2760083 RepID=UPI001F2AA3DC|nr:ferredoxin reductase [Tomitella gaofuii]